MKEARYFDSDIDHTSKTCKSLEQYLALFEQAPPGIRYLGEASPAYIYSRVAISRLMDMTPDAKIIVMARDPVAMARSWHSQKVQICTETVLDFEKAWHLQEQRRNGEHIPFGATAQMLQYADWPRLGSQVQRLLQYVPREQLHVIVYDDLAADPETVYLDVLGFLNLEARVIPDFKVINSSTQSRIPALHRLMSYAKGIRLALGLPSGLGIQKVIDRHTTKPADKNIRPAFRQELQEYFHKEIELLSGLINRDLSHWLK